MQPFVFCNPTKIVFGEGRLPEIGTEAAAVGSKALFVYGQSSLKKSGAYDRVVASLNDAGVSFVEFPGVRANPVLSHTREGIALARESGVDFIVAVGGGSVIDEAKAIAAGAVADGDVWDFYAQKATPTGALPLVAAVTLAATGTEMNGGTVITNEDDNRKLGLIDPHLNPRVTVMDPALTFTVPDYHTACGAVDAISHLMEPYLTHGEPWLPINERYAEGLIKTIMESADKILADPGRQDGRAEMMWAATLAWNGLMFAGAGAVGVPSHMIAHSLSALFDLAHGATLSIVMPAWMAWNAEQEPARTAGFAKNVLGIDESDPPAAAAAGIAALKEWFKKIGAPTTFADAEIDPAEIDRVVENVAGMKALWGYDHYTADTIRAILQRCV